MSQTDTARRLVLVVAAALVREDGRLLLQQRPPGKSMAGLWELPGGKIEPGESPESALAREIEEELGVKLDPSDLNPFTFASHPYETFDLLMPVFMCRRWHGDFRGREGQAIAWVAADELAQYPAPAADIPLFERFAVWAGDRTWSGDEARAEDQGGAG